MKRVGRLVAFFLPALMAGSVSAQVLLDITDITLGVGEYVPTGFSGVGARSMGMGGAALASVNDGTALFWNPAALTRVRRVELLGGLGHMRSAPSATVNGTDASASAGFTRLNSAVITAPYPVYRGGLTFAFGVNRPVDYTYRSTREGTITSGQKNYSQLDVIREDGGISQYAVGMGFEISQNVSFGVSAVWLNGNMDIRRDLTLVEQNSSLPDSLSGYYRENTDISGFALNIGTTARLPYGLQLGVSATPPVTYNVDGRWGDAYVEAVGNAVNTYDYLDNRLSYDIHGPWKLGAGLSWVTYAFTAEADVWFEDWSQASFKNGTPYDGISGVNTDTYFEDRYTSKVRMHIGVEALVPWVNTLARFGYYRNPDQFTGPVLASGQSISYSSDADYFTFGLGWLIDDTVTLDVAYVVGGDKYNSGPLTEERSSSRAFGTVAFRM